MSEEMSVQKSSPNYRVSGIEVQRGICFWRGMKRLVSIKVSTSLQDQVLLMSPHTSPYPRHGIGSETSELRGDSKTTQVASRGQIDR